jgi:hypothetical protein
MSRIGACLILRVMINIVGEVDQELSEAAFGSSIITKDGGESRISQRLWKTLAESLTSTSIVTQTTIMSALKLQKEDEDVVSS